MHPFRLTITLVGQPEPIIRRTLLHSQQDAEYFADVNFGVDNVAGVQVECMESRSKQRADERRKETA